MAAISLTAMVAEMREGPATRTSRQCKPALQAQPQAEEDDTDPEMPNLTASDEEQGLQGNAEQVEEDDSSEATSDDEMPVLFNAIQARRYAESMRDKDKMRTKQLVNARIEVMNEIMTRKAFYKHLQETDTNWRGRQEVSQVSEATR